MAVLKGLLEQKLKEKFKGKSLSKTFISNLAEKLATKIENEDAIDDYLTDREDFILEASAEADRVRTQANKGAGNPNPEKKEVKTEDEEIDTSSMTAFEKTMLKQMGEFKSELTGLKSQQTQKSIEERFRALPELKDVPALFFKGRIPTTEAEIEAAAAELLTDYTTFATENKLSALGGDRPGARTGGSGGEDKSGDEKVDPAIAKFGEKLQAAAATTTK